MTDIEGAEIERLRKWKGEAMPVLEGLQELGRMLDLPLGERTTGRAAVEAVNTLQHYRSLLGLILENVHVGVTGGSIVVDETQFDAPEYLRKALSNLMGEWVDGEALRP